MSLVSGVWEFTVESLWYTSSRWHQARVPRACLRVYVLRMAWIRFVALGCSRMWEPRLIAFIYQYINAPSFISLCGSLYVTGMATMVITWVTISNLLLSHDHEDCFPVRCAVDLN